jgi:RimJ/RimL family protein N-acetyltransferase
MAYRGRPDVARHLSAGVWTAERAESELRSYEHATFTGPGDELVLLAETRDTVAVVGKVGLVWRNEDPRTAEVGYVFNPAFGGRGLATEAVSGLVQAAFTKFDFDHVVATTDEDNASSRALCERLGMRLLSTSISTDDRQVSECTYIIGRERVSAR